MDNIMDQLGKVVVDTLGNGKRKSGKSAKTRKAAASQDAPNALALLEQDHQNVKKLFAEALKDDVSSAGRRRLFAEIASALTLHTQVEEKIFYPAFKAKTKANSDEREEVLEAFEEHASAKDLIRKLQRSKGRDESYRAKLQVLSELIDHHVREEESTMFPEARALLGEGELKKLGAEIVRAKERASKKRAPARRNTSPRKARR